MEKHIQKKMEEIRQAAMKRESLGVPGEPETTGDVCPLCGGRGLIPEGDSARVCGCMRQKALEHRFRHARLDGEYRNRRFDDFDLSYYPEDKKSPGSRGSMRQGALKCLGAARTLVQEVADDLPDHRGMYIFGSVGSGKTLLAACIANELIARGREVLFVVVPDLLDELRATFSNKNETDELTLMQSIRTVPVLILDDLGAHNYSEWTAGRLYNMINYRVNHRLTTVFTSNFSLSQLEEVLDKRTCSRILELCQLYRLDSDQDIRVKRYMAREMFDKPE